MNRDVQVLWSTWKYKNSQFILGIAAPASSTLAPASFYLLHPCSRASRGIQSILGIARSGILPLAAYSPSLDIKKGPSDEALFQVYENSVLNQFTIVIRDAWVFAYTDQLGMIDLG